MSTLTPEQLAAARAEMDAHEKAALAENKLAMARSNAVHARASQLVTVFVNDEENRGKETPPFSEFLTTAAAQIDAETH